MRTMTESTSELDEPFRILVENCHDILSIREADGRLRYVNPSFCRMLGYTQEEVVGRTCFDLIHPEDRDSVLTALDELVKIPGGRDSVRCRARHADGTWITFEIAGHNMLDHPVIHGLVINSRDISEWEQREAVEDPFAAEQKQNRDDLNSLSGILTICASCKKIHDQDGPWQQIERYIRDHAPVEFSHAMCPECMQFWYPENPTDEGD